VEGIPVADLDPVNREQLAHVIRAAASIAMDGDMIIIGSQAVLGSFDVVELPEEATLSVEADVAFWSDPGEEKADLVEGSIGEASPFHSTFGYYGQGVTVATARLPTGWEARLVPFDRSDTGSGSARCLEIHDLTVAKLVAGRDKDVTFAAALLAHGLIDRETLETRIEGLEQPIDRERAGSRLTGIARRTANAPTASRDTERSAGGTTAEPT
jgi:hypothetical protein